MVSFRSSCPGHSFFGFFCVWGCWAFSDLDQQSDILDLELKEGDVQARTVANPSAMTSM